MNKKIIKRIYNVVIILCFIGAIGWYFSHFYHGSDVVYTDDAQVNRHITPIQHARIRIYQGNPFLRLSAREEGRYTRHYRRFRIPPACGSGRGWSARFEGRFFGCISQHGNHHYQRADGFGRYRRGTCRHDERQAGFRPFCSPDEEGCGNPPAI